ncbi:hypothetical protein AGABI2DRAFT_140265 [Agaricus bisporus var. bisporus H97]|uniref:hypothetical protein n=1 Tax=Agaricus bisporus var. bisporus (strain H97 / ATCC MYA-4626 / FGSC 10389) TaxID=936046 RepID=UPI00029F5544|nr:hypothetical protein AGABI2DRAFT_140265 [Agaricus bisporus var. bisporus H97]EKV51218.1 hypothetical protein AGABI2DRAFT_140265 [Agaricus bisporus var. bisporus H97]
MDAKQKKRAETPATRKFSLFEQDKTYDADISDKDNSGPDISGRRFNACVAGKYTSAGSGGGGLEVVGGRQLGGNVSVEASGVDSGGKARVIRRKEEQNDEEYTHDIMGGYEADDEADN